MKTRRPTTRSLHSLRLALLLVVIAAVAGGVYLFNERQVRGNAAQMLEAARAADAQGNVSDAVKLYTDYLNFQSKDVDAFASYVALMERTTGQRPKGIRTLADAYERLLLLAPDRTADRLKLIDLYLSFNYSPGAKRHLDLLLDPKNNQPNDPDLLHKYALCEQRLGHHAEAAVRLRQAIATKKAGAESYVRLVQLLRNELRASSPPEEADEVLAGLVADKPSDPAALLTRAKDYLAQGKTAEAAADLEAARKSAPKADTNPDVMSLSAQLKSLEGQAEKARVILMEAVGANPKDARLRFQLSELLTRMNRLPQARQELQSASELIPADGPQALDIIDRKIDLGMIAEAKKDTARYAGKDDYRPVYDYLTGRLLLAEGNWPAAAGHLQKALPAFARLPQYTAKAQVALGRCHLAAGNPDRMADACDAALRADPESVLAQLARAESRAILGDWGTATAVFKRFASHSPEGRATYARYALGEQLSRPPARRNWSEFDAALGQPPYPSDLVLLKANSLISRGDPTAADALLTDAAKQNPDDPAGVALLAVLRGQKEAAAGFAVLAEADKRLGDRIDLRLARGRLLAKNPTTTDGTAIRGLAENVTRFKPAERYRLFAELGDLFAGPLAKPAEAESLYQKAAAEDPFNLTCRVALLDLALRGKDASRIEAALAEVRKLEGAEGPTVRLAEVVRDWNRNPKADRLALDTYRNAVAAVTKSRTGWARAFAVLADLDAAAGDSDAAVDHYRRAFDLGERSPNLVRQLVRFLFDRKRYDEAKRVLDRLDQSGELQPDLRQRLVLIDTAMARDPRKAAAVLPVSDNSNDPADHLFRGQALLLAGDRAAAATALEKAVALNPAGADAWMNLVLAYTLSGQKAAAIATVRRAEKAFVGADPTAVATATGIMLDTVGDLPAAEAAFRKALLATTTDGRAAQQLISLLLRTGRTADAVKELQTVVVGKFPAATQQWARRTLAFALLELPRAFDRIPAAVKLLDDNLAAGEKVEDLRAKAFVIGTDPFRRQEAKKLLSATADRGPLSSEELVRRANWAIAEGDLAAAETDLRDATRVVGVGGNEPLVALHRVQLARNRTTQAAETLERLRAVGAVGWTVAAAGARQLARTGKKDDAAKAILATPEASDPTLQLRLVAPFLAEIGCVEDAERLYRAAAEKATDTGPKAALAMFLVSHGRQAAAVETVRSSMPAFPVGLAAKVFTAAVATRPRGSLTPAELPAWDKTLGELAAWAAGNPADRDARLLTAVLADAQGKYEVAIRGYEQLLSSDSESVTALNNLAALLILTGKDIGTRPGELLGKALAVGGPRAGVLDTRAIWHTANGRTDAAVHDLEVALLMEQKPAYRYHLALAHDKAGNTGRKTETVDAVSRTLTKEMLHPLEWPEYQRLFGPPTQ